MKTNLRIVSALTLGLGVAVAGISAPAVAAEQLEPGMRLSIPFGGQRPVPAQFSLRLDYAQRLDPAETGLTLPVALEWRIDGSGRQALYGNGLLLGAGHAWRSDATEGEPDEGMSWGENLGTVLLAAGAALALIVVVAGEAAEDMHDGRNDAFEESVDFEEDGGSPEGDCQVPMPSPGDGCAFNP